MSSNVLLMNLNYVSSERLNGMTYSSQLTAAPATNVYDRVRRTKTWRTQGYWEITSSNKGIVLQEVDGVNQTVNIAEGNYTTDSSFLTAVKTALDSASGSATYTVTRNATTNKIVITSNGGGGAIFKLMCTNASFTAASLLGFSTAADRTGALTYTADNVRIHTSEFMRFDFGTSINPKAFALIGTRNDGVQISSTATVKLQGNATDVWTSPSFEQTLTWNERAICLFDTDGLHTSALRYWRLYIEDVDNPNGYVEISNLYLGDVFEPTQGSVQFPLDVRYIDYSKTERGEWGSRFSDVKQVTREFQMNWEFLSKTEAETLGEFVEHYKTAYPWWIALDPNEVFSTDKELFVCHCRFDELPNLPLDRPNQFSSRWSFVEEV